MYNKYQPILQRSIFYVDRIAKCEIGGGPLSITNLDDVEDEKHFLLKCPLYNEERLSLFSSVVLNVSAMSQGDVFVYLLSSKEPTTVKALGTFLHNAFMKREKAMNHYQS